jgi:hypothetical protein
MDIFREPFLVETQGEFVRGRCRQIRQSFLQLKDKCGSRQGTQGHSGIALLEAPKSSATDIESGSHIGR